ncbi:hypothetical protein [Streptomyces sp. NPDC058572]|uniref:hypothetical protein n=1 Tax=Streptomyces sp. NPDC058572 TaxID=3346546 RepID=UPI003664136E
MLGKPKALGQALVVGGGGRLGRCAAGSTARNTTIPGPRPKPGRHYAELVGGPLDGLLLDADQARAAGRACG